MKLPDQYLADAHCAAHDHYSNDPATGKPCPGCTAVLERVVARYEADAPLGRRHGIACDVVVGPCACGDWHAIDAQIRASDAQIPPIARGRYR